jgi:hypothetical protein
MNLKVQNKKIRFFTPLNCTPLKYEFFIQQFVLRNGFCTVTKRKMYGNLRNIVFFGDFHLYRNGRCLMAMTAFNRGAVVYDGKMPQMRPLCRHLTSIASKYLAVLVVGAAQFGQHESLLCHGVVAH